MNDTDKQILVWDKFVRIFHWMYLFLFILAYISGDDKGFLHRFVGYATIFIVLLRVFWGFFGTKNALFVSFVCSPLKAITYLKELVSGKPKYYIGHNPAAAWMILFLLGNTIIICMSGYMAYITKGTVSSSESSLAFPLVVSAYASDEYRKKGADSHNRYHEESNHNEKEALGNKQHRREREGEAVVREDSDGMWGDIHEASASFMLGLILLHVIGVALSSRAHKENLFKSMITGIKREH